MSEVTLRIEFAQRLNEVLKPQVKKPEQGTALVCKAFKVKPQMARRIMTGKYMPKASVLPKAAKCLGVTAGYLLYGEVSAPGMVKVRSVRPAKASIGDVRVLPSTEAQNKFGEVLAAVRGGELVAIARHDEGVVAVVVPVAEYERMSARPKPVLDLLTQRYDEMVASMQKPAFLRAIEQVFNASPQQLGEAAVKAATGG